MRAGILLLDKPQKMSSASAIAKVKKRLPGVSKIGHSGTLDPMATGLLICVLGGATRLARFAEAGEKIYSGTIRFGMTSDTDDIWGETQSVSSGPWPGLDDLERIKEKFTGTIMQVPPKVSALKVDGKRAYKLAREGRDFKLEAREVRLSELDFFDPREAQISFRIKCSKGFYVRSLARDLGAVFECGAVLSALRREASLPFRVEHAVSIEDVSAQDVREWDALFPSAPRFGLSEEQTLMFRNGNTKVFASLSQDLKNLEERKFEHRGFGGCALCLEQSSGIPLGLLVKSPGEDWKIAVNLSVG